MRCAGTVAVGRSPTTLQQGAHQRPDFAEPYPSIPPIDLWSMKAEPEQSLTCVQAEPPSSRPSSVGASPHLERLAFSILQQRVRHVKRVLQLQAVAVAKVAQNRDLQERSLRDQQRQRELERLREERATAGRLRAIQAELSRQERLAAAHAHAEALHQQAASKQEHGAARAAAVVAERREVAALARMRQSQGAALRLEQVQQRAALEEEERARFMRQRQQRHDLAAEKALEEKRAAEVARRAEEERQDEARRRAQARAEQEQEQRVAFHLLRRQQREEELQRRSEELAALRALKQQERAMKAAYARHRAELAAQREEERRAARSTRLAAKQQRVAAMEAERGAMLRALEGMRRNIRMQEKALKDMLQMEGAGLALPLQGLQRQLADLQLTPAAGSRTANRRSRRTASRTKAASAAVPAKVSLVLGGGDAATAGEPRDCQSACASPRSSTTAGSTSSPRIQAAPAPHPQTAGDGAGGKADTQGQSSGKLCESKDIQDVGLDDAAAEQRRGITLPLSSLEASTARRKLQRVLEVEMAREAERAVLLRTVAGEADRRRLLHLFETERANAMDLMQHLQQQLSSG